MSDAVTDLYATRCLSCSQAVHCGVSQGTCQRILSQKPSLEPHSGQGGHLEPESKLGRPVSRGREKLGSQTAGACPKFQTHRGCLPMCSQPLNGSSFKRNPVSPSLGSQLKVLSPDPDLDFSLPRKPTACPSLTGQLLPTKGQTPYDTTVVN